MNQLIISLMALIPVILLCWYIYVKDRQEKEPLGLLMLLLVAGAAAYFPAMWEENALISVVDGAFSSKITHSLSGLATYESKSIYALHSFACGFGAIALVEEVMKWSLLYLITHKNRNFDHLFDGVVYAAFLSMGFAAAENVFYAVRGGWSTFVLHSLTSVPGHLTFGVLMGLFYTMWRIYYIAGQREKELAISNAIVLEKPFKSGIWLAGSLVLPVILHGCYSFLKLFTSDIMTIVFYVFIVILYLICFVVVQRLSAADTSGESVAERMITRKYPSLNKRRNKSAK